MFRAFARTVAEGEDGLVVLDTAPPATPSCSSTRPSPTTARCCEQGSRMPESVRELLPRLRDPAFTRVLLVTLPEATPVHEARALQADLARAGITPFAWVVNQSLTPVATRDPGARRAPRGRAALPRRGRVHRSDDGGGAVGRGAAARRGGALGARRGRVARGERPQSTAAREGEHPSAIRPRRPLARDPEHRPLRRPRQDLVVPAHTADTASRSRPSGRPAPSPAALARASTSPPPCVPTTAASPATAAAPGFTSFARASASRSAATSPSGDEADEPAVVGPGQRPGAERRERGDDVRRRARRAEHERVPARGPREERRVQVGERERVSARGGADPECPCRSRRARSTRTGSPSGPVTAIGSAPRSADTRNTPRAVPA